MFSKLSSTARKSPSGLNAALAAELDAGSPIAVRRPVTRFSTRIWQAAAHRGTQATCVALVAITPVNARLGAPGRHSSSVAGPGAWTAGASSRPRSVPAAIARPTGSLTGGPFGVPAAPTSRATPDTEPRSEMR